MILGRYLGREILVGVGFVLAGFLALFAFFDFLNELDDVGRGGYRVQHALAFVLLGLPGHVYELVPIAALIGTIWALAQFASNSEFTAMRAAGLGRARALSRMVSVGLLLAVFTLVVGETAAPAAERFGQRLRLQALGTSVGTQFRSGLWMKDSPKDERGEPVGLRFVNVAEVLPDTTIRGVRVLEFDTAFRLRSILDAERGAFDVARAAWRLEAVKETAFLDTEGAAGLRTTRAEVRRDATRDWKSELTPAIVGVLMVKPDQMAVWDLVPYIRHLQSNRQNTKRYEAALWKKLFYPVATVVMLVLALPFGYMQVRAGSVGYKVFAGIMLGVAFHFLNGLFSNLGLLNTWPPWVAAAAPSLLALGVGLGLLWRVDRTR